MRAISQQAMYVAAGQPHLLNPAFKEFRIWGGTFITVEILGVGCRKPRYVEIESVIRGDYAVGRGHSCHAYTACFPVAISNVSAMLGGHGIYKVVASLAPGLRLTKVAETPNQVARFHVKHGQYGILRLVKFIAKRVALRIALICAWVKLYGPSQFLARHSDKQGDRKLLILLCCLFGVLACTLFAWNRNYFILLSTGVLLSSFASTANPQMFALAREHADRTGRETVMFSTFLRAQISLAWVIGPPLAYELAMGFSFKVMYLTAAIAFVVCGLIVWLFLPSIQRNIPVVTQPVEILPSTHRKRDTRLLFVVCSMMWAANNLYMINMPLFIIDELHLTDKLAGEMIGIAAGLEIPMMLIAGYYMKRIGKRLLMLIAIVSGMCFYASVLMATTPAVELELQILNAIFLGILCGIGMLYFQDLMPEKIGSAATLYANTSRVGWIIAGSVDGIMVEIWSYHALFCLAIGMLGIAMICLLFIKDI